MLITRDTLAIENVKLAGDKPQVVRIGDNRVLVCAAILHSL